ncbi:hypothetical protein H5410_026645 [Solanum commersonii]|uniref:Uncharacterized protein n=1 Tax=Solanum commersonii TaxID=4109 RepID=A0A9J5YX46_SOLCO|nr:hypothetical protein H5410_026645 [Solanum commersonii]
MTEREVKRDLFYIVDPSIGASMPAWVRGGRPAAIVVPDLEVTKAVALDVPKGLGSRVGKSASAGSAFVSTTGEVSTGVAFFFSASSFKNSTSILQMSVEDVGITSISFFSSLGTRAHLHRLMISTGKGRETRRTGRQVTKLLWRSQIGFAERIGSKFLRKIGMSAIGWAFR